jgi:hypothetical protein
MARRVKTGFAGEIFDQRRSRSALLADYLLIYANYLPPENRTASNELLEFLERPNAGQTIVYFGLSYYGKPCGFATLMLYGNSGIAIVDHIAIAPTVRGLGAFFTFCDLIAEYLERQKHSYNYIAAEIVLGDRPYTAGLTPLTLLRLTRFVGFRLANIPYFAPDITNVEGQKPNRAALMLLCQPDRAEIQADELLRIVRIIYFDHYLAWCERTMTPLEFERYRDGVLSKFKEISDFLEHEDLVKINGMKNLELPYVVDPHNTPPLNMIHFMILVAIPAVLTIAVSLAQETRVTVAVLAVSCIVYASLLIPRFRRPLLRLFEQE